MNACMMAGLGLRGPTAAVTDGRGRGVAGCDPVSAMAFRGVECVRTSRTLAWSIYLTPSFGFATAAQACHNLCKKVAVLRQLSSFGDCAPDFLVRVTAMFLLKQRN